jgi:hypothetical protein
MGYVNDGVSSTHLGEKLKMACDGAPIHSPRSRAFASETLHATMRVLKSSGWELT